MVERGLGKHPRRCKGRVVYGVVGKQTHPLRLFPLFLSPDSQDVVFFPFTGSSVGSTMGPWPNTSQFYLTPWAHSQVFTATVIM